MGFRKNKYMTGMSSRKNAVKTLSVAILAGCAMFGVTSQAQAEEVTNPSYTMKDGTETDYTYTTTDGENVNYYKVELSKPLSTSDSITWDDATSAGKNTISVQLPHNGDSTNPEIKYYTYTYTMPNGYTTSRRVTDISTADVENVLFSSFSGNSSGGAIYNENDNSSVNIISDFVGISIGPMAYSSIYPNGGAIYNSGTIGDISGDFIGNSVHYARLSTYGGAIANDGGTISSITGDFIGNYAKTNGNPVYGGAIYNSGTISSITGDFIGNYVDGVGSASGGAIYNTGTIDNITGDFIGNYGNLAGGTGGAINNSETGILKNITGDFIGNYVKGTPYGTSSSSVSGGAIYNSGTIGDISGDFIGNYTQGVTNSRSVSASAYGGAIYNNGGTIESITGNFISNYASSTASSASGGAIYIAGQDNTNSSVPSDILFYVDLQILNDDGSTYKQLFMVTDPSGNRYFTEEEIKTLVADGTVTKFQYVRTVGQIPKSELDAMIESEEGMTEELFYEMLEGQGYIQADPNDMLANTKLPEPQILVDEVRANEATITLENSNLIGNHADSTSGEAKGGAIYSDGATIKIEANNGETTLISGNYTKNGDVIDNNAIYMNGGNLIFDVTNGSTIQLDDNINGTNDYNTYIIGDSRSKFLLNNAIKNSTTHLIDTNLYLSKDSYLDGNNLKLHSGMLSMINNQVGVSVLNSLTVTGDTNMVVDVDLANQTMDRFSAKSYGEHQGSLNVTGMNLLSDATEDTTKILFAENGLKDNVTTTVGEVAYTPIYKYNVSYDKSGEEGYFVFDRFSTANSGSSGGASNPSESFNPAVLGSSSSATVGALGTMNQTMNNVFQHSDNYMHIPYLERVSMRDRNKYALSLTGDSTGMGRYSPLYQRAEETTSVWVKPYATFETVGLKNGPKVHNNAYGTLIGFDTGLQPIKRGWDRVFTGYIGYNGASQRYSGIDSIQNGGLIGGTVTMYKGNFFNATTVSVGANVAQNQTMYGSEDFAMLLSGIGNKTGYNFEFKEGKLILQPSMLMSYTFVNTFDYTNAAGVRIDNKPLHALQLAPGVKVIGNLKNGWQPYASVQMVWNLMGESDATANGVKLPEMSIKPYVQYGVGVQKRIKDHFTAYGQAMIQNGGRNGISLTAGFRWALGKDKAQKVEAKKQKGEIAKQVQDDRGKYIDNRTSSLDVGGVMPRAAEHKKILKQMTSSQKAAHGGKYGSTTRSAKAGMLRQL